MPGGRPEGVHGRVEAVADHSVDPLYSRLEEDVNHLEGKSGAHRWIYFWEYDADAAGAGRGPTP